MDTIYEVKNVNSVQLDSYKWVRSTDGWVAGVCEGIGQRFDISPNLIRLFWLISIFAFGTGLLVYFLMAISLPREDNYQPLEPRVLGVCSRIASKTGLEVGVVRFATTLAAISSLGLVFLFYFALHFVLAEPDPEKLY